MIRTTRITASLALVTLAAGCTNLPFIGDDTPQAPEYTKARSAIQTRKLEVPPDLAAPNAASTYSIPGITLSANGKQILASGAVLPQFDKAHMENDGNQRWLVVAAPVDTVWPQVRQFWLDQGYKLTVDNPIAALLETNWQEEQPKLPLGTIRSALQRGMKSSYNSGMADQYRMRLERGADGKSTEIYIAHRRMEEVYIAADRSDTRWTPRPSDPEREIAKLKQLLVRFGVAADDADKVVAAKPADPATSTSTSNRAQLITQADGKHAIQVEESFDRAWRRIGLALERAGYNINDRDRSLGIYYISAGQILAAKEEGFFDWMAFWKSDKKKEENRPQYQAMVASKDAQTMVQVSGKDGAALTEAQTKAVLDPLLAELR
ncbi:outer membrane protein assembly factor BamC [Chitinimonas sp. PSY-7]|uniref:outer membrane protein assembly factor BamC n=1 Tax=Chitinimonas sp. PSY-7 TaxID=3459088 RepID=UPI0040402C27